MGNPDIPTMHVAPHGFAWCRPSSFTASANSADCKQCDGKLVRLVEAAITVAEKWHGGGLSSREIADLEKSLEKCGYQVDKPGS